MTDPFDALARPLEPQEPRPVFARTLRARVAAELGLTDAGVPTIALPERNPTMSTATRPASAPTNVGVGYAPFVPYLAVHDGVAALEFYAEAFGADEHIRVVGDDGRIGHAGFTIAGAEFMLSSEYPEIGVQAPRSLGGTSFSIYLRVADVDATFAQAVAAGATALNEPADQDHGSRQGTLVDPFGHRWMVSHVIEDVSVADYAERAKGSGFDVVGSGAAAGPAGPTGIPGDGAIWAVAFYEDALAGIRQLVDVFGFEEIMVVTHDDGFTVGHSELRWPGGGVVQLGTYDPANPHSIPPGEQSLYIVTSDPQSVWERCVAAGLEVMQEPYEPHYNPGGMSFVVRDRERNIWSFGTHGLGEAYR